jgi:hypothetical protein
MKRFPSCLPFFAILLFSTSALADDTGPKPAAADKTTSGGGATPNAADQAAEPDSSVDAETPQPQKIGARPTSIAVLSEPGGAKTLNIHFRWSIFPDASIEVRLVPGPEAKGVQVAPVYYHEYLKGKVRDELFDCLDHPDRGGTTHSFSKDKIVYKMIGRRNSLGNQGVHVQVSSETPKKSDQPAAAFLQLDTWALDNDTLSLDLARDEFAAPGTLFVWFFRGDKAVWEEQIRWPGYK